MFSCCSDFVFAVTVIYIQKSPFPTTPPGSGCALLFLVADEFTGAAGEATALRGDRARAGNHSWEELGAREAAPGWSVCLKRFDLKHSNHVGASKDPVPVEGQSCHQSQGAERSLDQVCH